MASSRIKEFSSKRGCLRCGNPVPRTTSIYCTRECCSKHKLEAHILCPVCGNLAKQKRNTYCSPGCWKISIQGKHDHNVKFIHTPEAHEKSRRSHIGHVTSQETKDKLSAALKNKPHTDEHNRKVSGGRKRYWANVSDEFRVSHMLPAMAASLVKTSGTGIELKVRDELNRLGIAYEHQKQIGPFLVDFFLPGDAVIIECDGCYWHGCSVCNRPPRSKRRVQNDKSKDAYCEKIGIKLLRLKEHEINADVRSSVAKAFSEGRQEMRRE